MSSTAIGARPHVPFHGWRVASFAAALAFFAWGIGFYGPAVFLQTLSRREGWSVAAVSGAVTLHFALGAAIVWWLPELHRRFGLWRCTATGIVLAAAGALAWSVAARPWQPYAAAAVSAAGWALTSGATLNAIVSPWFDRQRPRAMALAFNGATTGGLVFAPLWSALIGWQGFPVAALVVGGAMLLALQPAAWLLLRRGPKGWGQEPDGQAPDDQEPDDATSGAAPKVESENNAAEALTTRSSLLRNRCFVSLSLPFALALFAQVGLLAHLLVRLTPALGAAHAAWAISTVAVSALAGRSLLARWLGARDRQRAAAANIGVQALGSVLLIAGDGAALLLAGCVLFGLGFGNLTSLPPLIAQQRFAARDVPTVVALVTAINQALFALAPFALGLLHAATHSYQLPFALALAAQLAAIAVLAGARRADARGG